MTEYNPFSMRAVRMLYNNKGFMPIAHDLVFKKILMETKGFAENLIYETLPIRRGSILELHDKNTPLIPNDFMLKVFHLDALFSIKVRGDNGDVRSHLVNIEAHHSRRPNILRKCVAYGGRLLSQH